MITGIADLAGELQRDSSRPRPRRRSPGTVGTFALLRQPLALDLVAHRRHRLDRRADELDLAAAADLGEVVVLGEKPVAGMNRLHVGDFRGRDDARDVQVRLRRRRFADADRLVRQLQIRRLPVGSGINDGRLDAHFAAGADDPQCDFSAVGDEDLREHRFRVQGQGSGFEMNPDPDPEPFSRFTRNSVCPNSTVCPLVDQDLGDRAAAFGLDVVEDLHRFDDADVGFLVDVRADGDERLGIGARRRSRTCRPSGS